MPCCYSGEVDKTMDYKDFKVSFRVIHIHCSNISLVKASQELRLDVREVGG